MKDFLVWPWILAGVVALTVSVAVFPEGNLRLAGFGVGVLLGGFVPLIGGALVRKSRKP